MTTINLHRYPIGATVAVPGWDDPCEIVGYETVMGDPQHWQWGDGGRGEGPIYCVNEGNVHMQCYQFAYAESTMTLNECACGQTPPLDEQLHAIMCQPHRCGPQCDQPPPPF